MKTRDERVDPTELEAWDLVRWRFNDETLAGMELERNSGTLYWCRSRIAIVVPRKGGLALMDTYWKRDVVPTEDLFISSDDAGSLYSLEDGRLELVFLANRQDLNPVHASEASRHKGEDVVNLCHPNGGQCYLVKGAKPDAAVIISNLEGQLRQAKAKVAALESQIDLVKTKGP